MRAALRTRRIPQPGTAHVLYQQPKTFITRRTQLTCLLQLVSTHGRQTSSADKKKGKKKKAAQGDNTASQLTNEPKPTVVAFPAVVPGSFDAASLEAEPVSRPKPKKKKAKKTGSTAVLGGGNRAISEDAQSESSATAPESSTQVSRPTKRKGSSVIEADGAWTRVEARKRNSAQPTLSDAGIASATGTSSPVAEPTEQQSLNTETNRRTLAEKLLPKPRRTGVEE